MAKKASVEDLRAMFMDSLCIYNNKPYYIENINGAYYAECLNLFSQRNESILMDEDTFSTPVRRIGFVNAKSSVVYMERNPVRRYKSGLSRNNMSFLTLRDVEYPHGDGTVRHLYPLKAIEIADAMFGKYPSIAECIENFRKGVAAMAFDHQFALTKNGDVYYKDTKVGRFKTDAKTPYDLVFHPQYQYLISLLDNNHEKSI